MCRVAGLGICCCLRRSSASYLQVVITEMHQIVANPQIQVQLVGYAAPFVPC
jgi:hypothetical protein